MNTVLLANQLVREANMLSEALHRDTMFRVTLTVRFKATVLYDALHIAYNNNTLLCSFAFGYAHVHCRHDAQVLLFIEMHYHLNL